MNWNRNKTEFDIVVMDLKNNPQKLKVKPDVSPEEIMKELKI